MYAFKRALQVAQDLAKDLTNIDLKINETQGEFVKEKTEGLRKLIDRIGDSQQRYEAARHNRMYFEEKITGLIGKAGKFADWSGWTKASNELHKTSEKYGSVKSAEDHAIDRYHNYVEYVANQGDRIASVVGIARELSGLMIREEIQDAFKNLEGVTDLRKSLEDVLERVKNNLSDYFNLLQREHGPLSDAPQKLTQLQDTMYETRKAHKEFFSTHQNARRAVIDYVKATEQLRSTSAQQTLVNYTLQFIIAIEEEGKLKRDLELLTTWHEDLHSQLENYKQQAAEYNNFSITHMNLLMDVLNKMQAISNNLKDHKREVDIPYFPKPIPPNGGATPDKPIVSSSGYLSSPMFIASQLFMTSLATAISTTLSQNFLSILFGAHNADATDTRYVNNYNNYNNICTINGAHSGGGLLERMTSSSSQQPSSFGQFYYPYSHQRRFGQSCPSIL